MKISPLRTDLIPSVITLMELGEPYIRTRAYSDYWAYAELFSTTCLVAHTSNDIVGAVIAFRSQDNPADIYVQDVMTHPDHRRQGISTALLTALREQAKSWGCTRLYLTSEPDNTAAHATWRTLDFVNVAGDRDIDGVSVTSNFKGPGKNRAVYQLDM
ncbi:MAG: GNAT family N-acetyltransferase [Actinophytocola sp.]|uniref:GNAT family N-acetyltransferase n=1 Tax=Actinophytocola sp. TaxID=1872138 RepID=UPI003C7093EC